MKARTVLTVVILATAFLPILNWYYHRLGNGSGAPLGFLALALAIGLAFQNRSRQQWTEVSAWYWHALFNPGSGPREAEILMTPLSENHE